ncbi:PHD finger transcription factor [Hirschfeldia incana]|nr:PHD finger transcription factor [Hirschfeldia incana]
MPATEEEEEPIFGWNNSGRRNLRRRKLLVGEKVEVRSVEEGFLGSWYSATVTSSKKRRLRTIRYDHILSDDATDYLVDTVDVSEVVEGLSSSYGSLRGRLRPVPPKLEVDRFRLAYGLCVDVYISEAWWEGVVFDRENGSEKRRVFFPDLGDEIDADIQSLRVTQDWDEITETWECRGRWLLLALIEKYEEDHYLPVSVKQLWYDIRVRVEFVRIREWTCSVRRLWEDLMLEVIEDNLKIIINQFLHQELELVKEASQAVNETDACLSGVEVIPPQEQQQFPSNDKDHNRASLICRSEESYTDGVTELSSQKSTANHNKVILLEKLGTWQPFDCVAKSCPQAVTSYIRASTTRVAFHVRKHIKYMGWTIEQMVDEGGRHRFRYLSPDGRLNEKSLRQVCFILKQRDVPLTPKEVAQLREKWTCDTHEMRSIVLALPASNRNVALGDGRKSSAKTLLECGSQGKYEVFNKNSGKFYPRNAIRTRERALYVGLETKTEAQGFLRLKSKRKQKPSLRYRSRENKLIVGSRDVNLSRTRGQTVRMLTDIKNRVTNRGKTHVSRSSKRVQRVLTPTSRNQSSRTILSWLIDNNVVLPRGNVRCRNQKDHTVRKEGKLTREGIKCSCCRRIFSISGFEAHANKGSCRAAANIFLDDGRSLLDCQVEAYKTRRKAQPRNLLKIKLRQWENDIVCSVCHYGGKLILCDGCPSAFHSSCLGLQDVPDGDWFCASCCCDACGQFVAKKYTKEEKLISCKQCERKYHPSCLHYDGVCDSFDKLLAEKWFCSRDCEEIFVNLCELIGKPREVGVEKNLTWRLVQSLESDTLGTGASKIEAVAETHCKLSVALDVMHELFEPMKRRHSGGDLAEDVIFSRWSKYKRLNFSGFYTVLLERNDELVTVATVRILGKKVAEMPFIGTRFQHRQQGMCRVFMNELEKVLIDLGVERLVMPAVPCVLDTWTNSFGFSKVTIPEKKDFLQFTFLEFGRTILCQKVLIKSSVADPIPSTVSLGETNGDIINIEDSSAYDDRSKVHEAEQYIRIEVSSASDDISEVHQAEKHLEESSSTKNPPEEIKTHEERLVKENRILKCYTRRRLKCRRLT